MRYTVEKSIVQVIGHIWQPGFHECAMEYTLTDYDLTQYKISKTNPTRESIERWISTNTGDFQFITDFSANIGDNKVVPWKTEESEYVFSDCMNNEYNLDDSI